MCGVQYSASEGMGLIVIARLSYNKLATGNRIAVARA
jgi:hypothetical protein